MGEARGGDGRPAEAGHTEHVRLPEKPVAAGREGRLELNVPQVAGSAVAAIAAAKLASNLGVYGTILGAGVVSVLGTCGGSILQHVFRRTGRQVQEAAVQARPVIRRGRARTGRTAGTAVAGETAERTRLLPDPADPADPAGPAGTRATVTPSTAPGTDTGATPSTGTGAGAGLTAHGTGSDTGLTAHGTGAGAGLTAHGTGADTGLTDFATGTGTGPTATASPADTGPTATNTSPDVGTGTPADTGPTATASPRDSWGEPTSYRVRRRNWKRPAVAVALAFGLTMAGITGYEAIAGENISGNGHGTTIGNAVTGHGSSHSGGTKPTPAPGGTDTPTGGATTGPQDGGHGGRTGQGTDPSTRPSTSTAPGSTGTGTRPTPDPTSPQPTTPPPTTPASPQPTSPTPAPSGDGNENGNDGGLTP